MEQRPPYDFSGESDFGVAGGVVYNSCNNVVEAHGGLGGMDLVGQLMSGDWKVKPGNEQYLGGNIAEMIRRIRLNADRQGIELPTFE